MEILEIMAKDLDINNNFNINVITIIDELKLNNRKWTDLEILLNYVNELYLEWKLNND